MTKAFTLVELLISMFIFSVMIVGASFLLYSSVKTNYITNKRLQIKDDLDFVLELIKRDISSADPTQGDITCGTDGDGNAILSLPFIDGRTIKYKYVPDDGTIQRCVDISCIGFLSQGINVTRFTIDMTDLPNNNKLLVITVNAEVKEGMAKGLEIVRQITISTESISISY